MKKSFFVLSLMATTILSANAWADDVNCYDCMTASNCPENSGCQSRTNNYGTVYYKIDGTAMTVYGPTTGEAITVPEQSFVNTSPYWRTVIPSTVTSLDFTGNISSIGSSAFNETTSLTSINLSGIQQIGNSAFWGAHELSDLNLTGVQSIGGGAFQSSGLSSVDLTGVTSVGYYAFVGSYVNSVVFPASFFDEQGKLKSDISEGAFGSGTTYYCPQGVQCKSTAIRYTQDEETGVYTVGDKMYASALDLTHRACTGTWSNSNKTCTNDPIECTTGLRDCQIRALTYQGDKCKTSTECGNLIDMVSDSNYACDSITACSNYARTNNLSLTNLSSSLSGTGSATGSGKRIYTVEEARAAVEAAGTETVNFRIRYK